VRRIIFALAALVIVTGLTACGAAAGSTKPEARPTVTKTIQVPGPTVTKTITKTITNSAMTTVSVPDPSGGSYNDTGWRTTIPCLDAGGQLIIGDGGGGGNEVSETCTLTIVELQPASEGLAVLLTDDNGNETNFSLDLAG
jgi:hypothetical protein